MLLTPTLAHGLVFALRFADKGMNAFYGKFKFIFMVFCIGILALVAACFLFVSWKEGAAFAGILVVIVYCAA